MNFPLRRIRSFVRRDSRITMAQKTAMVEQKSFILSQEGIYDFNYIFKRESHRVVEIGFGSGHSLVAMAKAFPEKDFIGIETHSPGIGALLLAIKNECINNIRIIHADATEVLSQYVANGSIDTLQIFFPDPWPKRKHHKRRLIQRDFIELIANKLKPRGCLHIATDWEDYAKHIMNTVSLSSQFSNLAGEFQFSERSSHRPVVTKFEQRGKASGRKIWDMQFKLLDKNV